MKNFIHIIFISFIFFFAPISASAKVNFLALESITSGIEITVDQYTNTKTISGPLFITQSKTANFFRSPFVLKITSFFKNPLVLTSSKQVRLVSKINNNGLNTAYIELKDTYQDEWRIYSRAIDKEGNQMNFQKIDIQNGLCVMSSCNRIEESRIFINLEYLENTKESGIDIQVYGQRGGTKVILSSDYIISFLSYLNQLN